MRKIIGSSFLAIALIATVFASLASAQVGVFKVELTGVEYCTDPQSRKNLNANNNIDLWVDFDFPQADPFFSGATFSRSATFGPNTTFPMPMSTFVTATNNTSSTLAFVGLSQFAGAGAFGEDVFLSMAGTIKINEPKTATDDSTLAAFSGTFHQNGLFDLDCFSSGKFTSKKATS